MLPVQFIGDWEPAILAPVNKPCLTKRGDIFLEETQTPSGNWMRKHGSTLIVMSAPEAFAHIHDGAHDRTA